MCGVREGGDTTGRVLAQLIPEFVERTGINVVWDTLPYEISRERKILEFTAMGDLDLAPNAYPIQRLPGALAVDHSSVGNIGGVYDIAARRWSETMCERLGVPVTLVPAPTSTGRSSRVWRSRSVTTSRPGATLGTRSTTSSWWSEGAPSHSSGHRSWPT